MLGLAMLRCTSTATYNFKQGLLGLPLFSIHLDKPVVVWKGPITLFLLKQTKKSRAFSQNADPALLVVNFVSTDLSSPFCK